MPAQSLLASCNAVRVVHCPVAPTVDSRSCVHAFRWFISVLAALCSAAPFWLLVSAHPWVLVCSSVHQHVTRVQRTVARLPCNVYLYPFTFNHAPAAVCGAVWRARSELCCCCTYHAVAARFRCRTCMFCKNGYFSRKVHFITYPTSRHTPPTKIGNPL